MRTIAAEKRADGVFVAAGVELIEPQWEYPDGRTIPAHRIRLGDRLWSALEHAVYPDRPPLPRLSKWRMPLMLLRCRCGAFFVGAAQARLCPACKSVSVTASTKAAGRRFSQKRRLAPNPACRACGAPLTAERATKAFCSVKCRVAAFRARRHNQEQAAERPAGGL